MSIKKMKVIEINEGVKIDYAENGTEIVFANALMVNITKYQRDWPVHIDICLNHDKQLVIGTSDGMYYVAQLNIPEIQYISPSETVQYGQMELEDGAELKPLPLDMENVTLTLFSLYNPNPTLENRGGNEHGKF